MIYTQADLSKLILDTKAVSIWDHAKGPVFWYAANVPGPFYVNTEMVIGASLAEKLLREITAVASGTVDAPARAAQLKHLILDAYRSNTSWQRLIETMIDRARTEFASSSFAMISGGERRDWLFSIPFAHECNLPHLYLFKNKTSFCEFENKEWMTRSGQNVLHVSDLINNAASFFDSWQPILQNLSMSCAGNICINLRGENGLRRLTEAGQKTVALMTIDLDFFRRLHAADLLSREVFEEIAIFLSSSQDWASRYLLDRPELFNVHGCDTKSFERLKFFIANDPWKMRGTHESFFATMQKAIAERSAKAA